MKRFRLSEEITEFVERQRKMGKTTGFSPTMGALHAGHLSLLERSQRENNFSVASIFVNPTQFDRSEDLEKYPRTEEQDCAMLEEQGCDGVFLPTVDDIYPEQVGVQDHWDFEGLDQGMEGSNRPGHFDGVAQVVKILLNIVKPDRLYLGQKDYQQFCILRKLVELEEMPVEVRMCPIVREPDGLAMSSRNVRLSPAMRSEAVAISRALFSAREHAPEESPEELREILRKKLEENPYLKLEYVEIADPDTLQPLEGWKNGRQGVICVAAWVDGIRLIDNVLV